MRRASGSVSSLATLSVSIVMSSVIGSAFLPLKALKLPIPILILRDRIVHCKALELLWEELVLIAVLLHLSDAARCYIRYIKPHAANQLASTFPLNTN